MRIDVFTIFPGMVEGFAGQTLLGRAKQNGLLDIRAHDLRSASTDVRFSQSTLKPRRTSWPRWVPKPMP